jgi:hypothetical protein
VSWARKTPMKPGTKGLRRTGFKSQGKGFKAGACTAVVDVDAHIVDGDERFVVQDDDRHAARAARQLVSAHETRELVAVVGVAALVSTDVPSCTAIEKECAISHEGYRRLVASMRCCWCGREGRSNHAHENEGKGMGLKVDDRRAMPLCVDDMGQHGCHYAFDQYSLIDGGRDAHVELGRAMAATTRKAIHDAGLWPKNLPVWMENQELVAHK